MPAKIQRRTLGEMRADRLFDKVPADCRPLWRRLPISRSRRRTLNRLLHHTNRRQRSTLIATAVCMGWPLSGPARIIASVFGIEAAASWANYRAFASRAYRDRLFGSIMGALCADIRPDNGRWSDDAFRALTGAVESEILLEKERIARGFDGAIGLLHQEFLGLTPSPGQA